MSAREKQLLLQREREDVMFEQIRSGKAIRVTYEDRKKKPSIPNRLNISDSPDEEMEDRQDTVERATAVYRQMIPGLLKKLSHIKDPRSPGKIKHKMTVLMLYGILMFVFQIGSRRKANQTMTRIRFENLQAMFPELETMPHADTLARLLEKIEVIEIQECMIELLKDLIKRKKFRNFLYEKNYLIAIDGTQKLYRAYEWYDKNEGLVRHVGEDKTAQYYVYVLESVLILDNGITLPLWSLFLKNEENEKDTEDVKKQDCEQKAFYRLAAKLKEIFRNSKITIVLDGLYACGPIIRICRRYKWDFMIVLKDKVMSEVWDEALGLMQIAPENRHRTFWGDREQDYTWANDIEYEFVHKNTLHRLKLHVVICYETWQENHSNSTGEVKECKTRYAWISSKRLSATNVFRRCTKMGRYRWKIESNILVVKHQGYYYEHCYSYTWNAMEGYHYLMNIGRFINVMAVNSELLLDKVKKLGIRGFIGFLRTACDSLLDKDRIIEVTTVKRQWRLALTS